MSVAYTVCIILKQGALWLVNISRSVVGFWCLRFCSGGQIEEPFSLHSFIYPSIHPSVHPLIRPSTRPPNYPFIHPSNYSFIYSSTHSSIHTSIRPFINSFIHPYKHPNIPFIHNPRPMFTSWWVFISRNAFIPDFLNSK